MNKKEIIDNVNSVLDITATLYHDEDESLTEQVTKKGNVAVSKVYGFVQKVGKRDNIMVTNPELIQSIDKIMVATRAQIVMSFVICKEMAKIADSGKLADLGFKNIAELGKALFGYQTSTSNHYVRIGRNFITDDYKLKEGLPSSLTTSHLIELNALVDDDGDISTIQDMYLEGTLSDGMSTKRIREAIKAFQTEIIVGDADNGDADNGDAENSNTDKVQPLKEDSSISKKKKITDELAKAMSALAKFNESMIALSGLGINVQNYDEQVNALADMVKNLIPAE